MFLVANSLEEIKLKLGKLHIVNTLRAMNQDFDHIRDQILTSQEVSSMKNLTTFLLLLCSYLKFRNPHEYAKASPIVSNHGSELVAIEEGMVAEDVIDALIVIECIILMKIVTCCMAFLTRHQISANLKETNQSFLVKNIGG